MPYGITQCYLPPDRGENPAFKPQPKQVLDLATPEGCKAELTYVTWKRIGWELNPRPVCQSQVQRSIAAPTRKTLCKLVRPFRRRDNQTHFQSTLYWSHTCVQWSEQKYYITYSAVDCFSLFLAPNFVRHYRHICVHYRLTLWTFTR